MVDVVFQVVDLVLPDLGDVVAGTDYGGVHGDIHRGAGGYLQEEFYLGVFLLHLAYHEGIHVYIHTVLVAADQAQDRVYRIPAAGEAVGYPPALPRAAEAELLEVVGYELYRLACLGGDLLVGLAYEVFDADDLLQLGGVDVGCEHCGFSLLLIPVTLHTMTQRLFQYIAHRYIWLDVRLHAPSHR